MNFKRIQNLFNHFRLWKRTAAIQNLLLRPIHHCDVIPSWHDRQEVGLLGVTAEADRDATSDEES